MSTKPIRRRSVLLGAAAVAGATQLPEAAFAYPTYNIKTSFGAVGNGVVNDSQAFRAAAAAITAAGGGTLDIPAGVYIVGEEDSGGGITPYYRAKKIFDLGAVAFLHIRGAAGAVLRLAPGLHYGSFNPTTGAPHHEPGTGEFTGSAYKAEIGWMIGVIGGSNITIEDLELDGNNDQLVLGGRYGDTGIQLKATGIRLLQCTDVAISDIHTHHHGLDGLTIGWGGLTTADPPKPHTVSRVRSEYNGRQAFSWTGGNSLTVTDSQFNHTGRAAVRSAPSAGVDIEAESSITRNGYFNGCEFINNFGAGVDCTHGDSGYTRFEGCTFWGTTNRSVYVTKPGLVFKWSNVYGSCNMGYGDANTALATRWGECLFEDKPWTNGQVYRENYLISDAGTTALNVQFADCTFVARALRSIWANDVTVQKSFLRCTIDHRFSTFTNGGIQCHPWGCRFVACNFIENMGGSSSDWYIHLNDVVVDPDPGGMPTTVAGPTVHWGSPTGITGPIPVGPYG